MQVLQNTAIGWHVRIEGSRTIIINKYITYIKMYVRFVFFIY